MPSLLDRQVGAREEGGGHWWDYKYQWCSSGGAPDLQQSGGGVIGQHLGLTGRLGGTMLHSLTNYHPCYIVQKSYENVHHFDDHFLD